MRINSYYLLQVEDKDPDWGIIFWSLDIFG